MFRQSLTNRAVGLLGLTMMALGAVAGPSVAQGSFDGQWHAADPKIGGQWHAADPSANSASTPLRVYFKSLYCIKDSGENPPNPRFPSSRDGDEPYAVIFAADLRGGGARGAVVSPAPLFKNVHSGQTRNAEMQIWDLSGNGAPIGSVDDYVFLVALMEEDYTSPGLISGRTPPPKRYEVVDKVRAVLNSKVQSYKASGMSRSAIAGNLRNDMSLAIDASRGDDDRVGGITELFFTPAQLDQARAGTAMYESREFTGTDSAYLLTFRVQ